MHKPQQRRQRHSSTGQHHLGARGALHGEVPAAFGQAGNNCAASWSAIPYTGRHHQTLQAYCGALLQGTGSDGM
jgi:hypothetical protein